MTHKWTHVSLVMTLNSTPKSWQVCYSTSLAVPFPFHGGSCGFKISLWTSLVHFGNLFFNEMLFEFLEFFFYHQPTFTALSRKSHYRPTCMINFVSYCWKQYHTRVTALWFTMWQPPDLPPGGSGLTGISWHVCFVEEPQVCNLWHMKQITINERHKYMSSVHLLQCSYTTVHWLILFGLDASTYMWTSHAPTP